MKVAIVHDWLVQFAGAERVLKSFIEMFPEADLYTTVDFMAQESRGFLKNTRIITSFIQRLPFAKKKYRSYLPLMPLAIESFDLSAYDLILSSHHSIAKGVIIGPEQRHICYCHSPIRYAWDLQHEYFNEARIGWGVKGWFMHYLLHKLRIWDRESAGVDDFIAVSTFIQKRIARVYRRDSVLIHPPVDINTFEVTEKKEDFFLIASRMVPYKRIYQVVEAFCQMPDKQLVVIGDGPEFKRILKKAKKARNIRMMGFQPDQVLREYLQKAKGFIFAAKEDFGILPVEAQACGTPVIGFGKGGLVDSIVPGETGLFFDEQTPQAICEAVSTFENMHFCPFACRRNAARFDVNTFKEKVRLFIESKEALCSSH